VFRLRGSPTKLHDTSYNRNAVNSSPLIDYHCCPMLKTNLVVSISNPAADKDDIGPCILEEEVATAIKELKNNKAEGIDEISAECSNVWEIQQ